MSAFDPVLLQIGGVQGAVLYSGGKLLDFDSLPCCVRNSQDCVDLGKWLPDVLVVGLHWWLGLRSVSSR